MTKPFMLKGLYTALVLLSFCAPSLASSARETPTVLAVKRAKSAVANIHSIKTTRSRDLRFPTGKGRKVSGMGTGIIIDERGYIVTNHHVVHGVDSLRVTLFDGSTFEARTIVSDPKNDLAIIKINPSGPLQVIPLGTSSDLMLGETVIAVGNAYGYEHSITVGIVSALSRNVDVNAEQSYKNLIQTDASINPGNSGGPLLNVDGEVVGINVAIRANAQRIGFAIPIDDARLVIAKLLGSKHAMFHGLILKDVKTPNQRALVVKTTEPSSPALKSGFETGDVIIKIDKIDVADGVDFQRSMLDRSIGEKLEVVVRRGDETKSLTLILQRQGAGQSIVQHEVDRQKSSVVARGNKIDKKTLSIKDAWNTLGLRLAKIAEPETLLSGTRYDGGMRVVGVRHSGPAEINGIREGDILVGLHLWETTNSHDVAFILDHKKLSSWGAFKFWVFRDGQTLWGRMRADLAVHTNSGLQ